MTPEVYKYLDYRKYLKDFYKYSKQNKAAFTYQSFSKKAGLSSPAHLSLVIKGERGLSYKSIEKFAIGLGLNKKEREYFETLVYLNQSRTLEHKSKFWKVLAALRQGRPKSVLKQGAEEVLYSHWYSPILYELTLLDDFSMDEAWLVEKLNKQVPFKKIQSVYLEMEKVELISWSIGQKRYLCKDPSISSSDEIKNIMLHSYQKEMIARAIKEFDSEIEEREITCLTFSGSKEDFKTVKAEIKQFVNQLNARYGQTTPRTEVYQLNCQLFKLCREKS